MPLKAHATQYVDKGQTVTLPNSGYETSGQSGTNGGAIYNKGTLIIKSDTTFYNNSATNGGAIVNLLGGSMNIDNAKFDQNKSIQWGGAIYTQNKSEGISITASEFTGNEAGMGGAIFLGNWGDYNVNIENTNFIGNKGQESGAIQTGTGATQDGKGEVHPLKR